MKADELEVELNSATTEMMAAAQTVKKMDARIGVVETRLTTVEDRIAGQGVEIESNEKEIEAMLKKMPMGKFQQAGRRSNPFGFKEFADFVASGEPMQTKLISEQTGNEGRHALPLDISEFVQDQLTEINPIRKLANVLTTDTTQFRHLVNVKGATSAWGEEVDTRDTTATPQIEKIEPLMVEHYAYAEITQWAARDLFNGRAESWLRENIIEEFARAEGEKFVKGTGVGEPSGILNAPRSNEADDVRAFGTWQAIASGDASGFSANLVTDKLVDTIHSLGARYRRNSSWLMNSQTAGYIRKIKDGDGRFIWTDSLMADQPSMLLGYPVYLVEEMPDIAADETPIFFGDVRRSFLIADLQGLYVVRDEVTKPGWIKLYMFRRLGSHVTDTKAGRLIEISA